jgi:hypothetical protein
MAKTTRSNTRNTFSKTHAHKLALLVVADMNQSPECGRWVGLKHRRHDPHQFFPVVCLIRHKRCIPPRARLDGRSCRNNAHHPHGRWVYRWSRTCAEQILGLCSKPTASPTQTFSSFGAPLCIQPIRHRLNLHLSHPCVRVAQNKLSALFREL